MSANEFPPRLAALVEAMRKVRPGEWFDYGAVNLNYLYEAQRLAGVRVTARLQAPADKLGIKTWRVWRYE